MIYLKTFEKYKAKEFTINYQIRFGGSSVYKQTINLKLETFEEIKIKFEEEIRLGCPRHNEYNSSGASSAKFRLEARSLDFDKFDIDHYNEYIVYLNLTQARLIQLLLKDMGVDLKLKGGRNTCIKIIDGEEYHKLKSAIEEFNL